MIPRQQAWLCVLARTCRHLCVAIFVCVCFIYVSVCVCVLCLWCTCICLCACVFQCVFLCVYVRVDVVFSIPQGRWDSRDNSSAMVGDHTSTITAVHYRSRILQLVRFVQTRERERATERERERDRKRVCVSERE